MLSTATEALLKSPPSLEYAGAAPFPNAVFDNVFDEGFLNEVSAEFPNLAEHEAVSFNRPTAKKLASKGTDLFGPRTTELMSFLTSESFLTFLQRLTGIKETLISDPYFEGGGYHEIKPGGFLKIHSDFNRHERTGLDRRINVLIYLNRDWRDEYGGHFEMWDRGMTDAQKRVAPIFNRMVVFNTDDYSFHGHPDPLTCPPDRSRRSLALYYYSNGRPHAEVSGDHSTLHQIRPGKDRGAWLFETVKDFIPPILVRAASKRL